MAKTRPSVQKRNRDAKKREKAQLKAERKAARAAAREDDAVSGAPGVDPDLVGIVWGPQPTPDDEDEADAAQPGG